MPLGAGSGACSGAHHRCLLVAPLQDAVEVPLLPSVHRQPYLRFTYTTVAANQQRFFSLAYPSAAWAPLSWLICGVATVRLSKSLAKRAFVSASAA